MQNRFLTNPLSVAGAKIRYCALVTRKMGRSIHWRDVMAGAGGMALIFLAAEKAVEGPLAMPAPNPVLEQEDPTLIAVGETPIRLSDALAQAEISPVLRADVLEPSALFETGLVDEAADQVALAKRAEEMGLDGSLEVRAQLALARRRILSTALLDLSVSREVNDYRVQAIYDAEVASADADQRLHMRRIQVSSAEEGEDIRAQVEKGVSFADMARRRSLDMESRQEGGLIPPVRLSDLPLSVAAAVADLPIGAVSAPVKAEQGWYVMTVDTRAAVRLPPLEVMRASIERELRAQVVSETIAEARAAVPIRLAGLSLNAGLFGNAPIQTASAEITRW